MKDILAELKKKAAEILPEVSYFICYGSGFDLLHSAPLFVKDKGDIDRLVLNRFCIHNLTSYLPPQKWPPGWLLEPGEKIGLVLKGCDSRSVIHLLAEKAILRSRVIIIGLPCWGMIDVNKLRNRIDINRINRVEQDKESIMLFTDANEVSADIKDILYDKCINCQYPNTLISDHFIGAKKEPDKGVQPFGKVLELERMSLLERSAFWDKEFARCIRCKACRNVCPVCYCQNNCLLDTRVPHWIKERVDANSNRWYHLIRAFHLAGRCTECGECARVCPMRIPINLLAMKMNSELFELFGFRSGIDVNIKPPLMTFQLEEDKL